MSAPNLTLQQLQQMEFDERHDCGKEIVQVIICEDCPTVKMHVPVRWNRMDSDYDLVGGAPICPKCEGQDWIRGELICGCGYEF